MRAGLKLLAFFLIFLLFTQLALPDIIPAGAVYKHRLSYDIINNNINNLDAAMIGIKKDIEKHEYDDYIVILGDSVGFSTPCPPENSIGFYLNEIAKSEGKDIKTYNLSIPSMMAGDVYSIIMLLNQYDISTDNLIIDQFYSSYLGNSPIFWMQKRLKYLDPKLYDEIYHKRYHVKESFFRNAKERITLFADTKLSLFTYKDYISHSIRNLVNQSGQDKTLIQPWYKKDFLPELMNKEENRWYYTDKPFTLDDSNTQAYFMNKVIDLQQGKNTLIFLPAMNDQLLKEGTSKAGYRENLLKIEQFYSAKSVKFVNYNGKIDYDLFSDHVHLLPAGYEFLAEDLWSQLGL